MNENIKKVCVKYLMNEANVEELETLENWLRKPKNKQLFANYIKVNYAMDININPFNTESAKKEYLEKIRKDKRSQKKRKLLKTVRYSAAAILVIALASTYFLRDSIFNGPIENTAPIIVNNKIEKGTDKATLTLEDGSTVILEKGTTYQAKNTNSNGEQIIYQPQLSPESSSRAQSRDNILTIPRGGEFFVQLSDGTKVWLNSESQLKYPVAFIEGKTRQVELIYGEAYFEVSPSTTHNGATFKVFNKAQEIEVLGTKFNIKAYKDEFNIYTTLVEGKVVVNTLKSKQLLKPDQQSNLDLTNNNISIAMVNTYSEISWKDGVFSFRGKPLKEIMKILSRWYDVDVVFVNKSMEDIPFKGVLGKDQNMEEILSAIKNASIINTYEINEKTILIK